MHGMKIYKCKINQKGKYCQSVLLLYGKNTWNEYPEMVILRVKVK